MRTISEAEAMRRFRSFVRRKPNQRIAASSLDVGLAYLNDMLHGRRRLNDKVLSALRLRRVREIRFEIVEPE